MHSSHTRHNFGSNIYYIALNLISNICFLFFHVFGNSSWHEGPNWIFTVSYEPNTEQNNTKSINQIQMAKNGKETKSTANLLFLLFFLFNCCGTKMHCASRTHPGEGYSPSIQYRLTNKVLLIYISVIHPRSMGNLQRISYPMRWTSYGSIDEKTEMLWDIFFNLKLRCKYEL